MGVSLETYRSRIGTFSNKNAIKSKMSDISVSKCEQNKRKLDYKLFLIFAIVVAYSSICPVDVLSQSSNHSGGRYFHHSGRIVNSDLYLNIPSGRSTKVTRYLIHPSGRSSESFHPTGRSSQPGASNFQPSGIPPTPQSTPPA